jgi:hypothetical protein
VRDFACVCLCVCLCLHIIIHYMYMNIYDYIYICTQRAVDHQPDPGLHRHVGRPPVPGDIYMNTIYIYIYIYIYMSISIYIYKGGNQMILLCYVTLHRKLDMSWIFAEGGGKGVRIYIYIYGMGGREGDWAPSKPARGCTRAERSRPLALSLAPRSSRMLSRSLRVLTAERGRGRSRTRALGPSERRPSSSLWSPPPPPASLPSPLCLDLPYRPPARHSPCPDNCIAWVIIILSDYYDI